MECPSRRDNPMKIVVDSCSTMALNAGMNAPLHPGLVKILPLVLIGMIGVGCSTREDSGEVGPMSFEVVDSLLGPACAIAGSDIQVNPPIGFEPAADSIWSILKARLSQSGGEEQGLRLVRCFLDTINSAGLMISVIDRPALSSDTTAFVARYRQSLVDLFGIANVREGDYLVRDIHVKNFLVTDSVLVRFQLLCLSDTGSAVELTYFAARSHYPQLIKHFESSIGSLRLRNSKEGV